MLSIDLKNFADSLGKYSDTGIEISGVGILAIVETVKSFADQARALESSTAHRVVDFAAARARRDGAAGARTQGLKAPAGVDGDPDPKGAA
ncbi:hypothetical protein [Varunaivibrio sulfuroxidans]|uniref:Uncharacterized protein n=1 Tax=Varunaivibrio sulfuroxidans TaxID=1773489 RepID=A0A4V2UNM2_9PROT|nr:hypothetical protein [Varunaivibrio sulfuroxidans]TCS62561.1 hypothetical protein EDD55_105107 [Varunaivibrio sulfuroxidans]WES30769.1 hypothetical protein P3M64_14230 [Varunaivibrio sulfuroxidans]